MTGNSTSENKHPIDVIIAWVDGNDPKLAEKRAGYHEVEGRISTSSGAHSTRFASNNEIRYCVLSILKFAPFIRNIYIITDEQNPGLDEIIKAYYPERLTSVKIIDHKDIFEGFESCLPTFNSISIGNMIWRIDGLSENFVYFNDDTFLIRDFRPEDWFTNDKPVIRGKWALAPRLRLTWNFLRVIINTYILGKGDFEPRASFHLGQWASASVLGFRLRYFTNSHTPHTVGLSIIKDFYSKNMELLKKNISYRFRSYKQFTFISLSNHLQLQSGNRQISRPELVYMKPYARKKAYIDKKLYLCETNDNVKFLCVQSLDLCTGEEQDKVLNWLDTLVK